MPAPDLGQPSGSPPSLLQLLQAYLRTWLEVAQTRAEILSTELEEERDRLQELLILGAAAVFCLMLGVLLLTLLVVAAFWETEYRLAVLGGFGVLYLLAGGAAGLMIRRKSKNRPKLFAVSLGELAKDYQHLSS